jgi:hypothetical protein
MKRGTRRLFLGQEGIAVPLLPDRSGWPVPGMNEGLVRQRQQLGQQRFHDFLERPAPQIRTANAASKQGVTRKQNRIGDGHLLRARLKKQTAAAGRVARGMNDLRPQVAPL